MDVAPIRLLILDVDGVLTDGSLVFSEQGERTKQFCVQDGLALKLWVRAGGTVGIISGRSGEALSKRAAELGIEHVYQGVQGKGVAYTALLSELGVQDGQTAYVGDDLPDLDPMRRCRFPVAVGNAVPAVKREANYVTRAFGGSGAVREVVEFLLRKQDRWNRDLLASV